MTANQPIEKSVTVGLVGSTTSLGSIRGQVLAVRPDAKRRGDTIFLTCHNDKFGESREVPLVRGDTAKNAWESALRVLLPNVAVTDADLPDSQSQTRQHRRSV